MIAGLELASKRAEYSSHAAGRAITSFSTFEKPQPLLEHGNGGIAIARIDVPFILAGETPLGRFGVRINEARIEEHRFRCFAVMAAVGAATHELRRLAPALRFGEISLMAVVARHQFCTHGRPADFQPPTVPRWPRSSRFPSKPSAML